MILNGIKFFFHSQRIKSFLTNTLCWGIVVIPSQNQNNWKELSFSSTPPNRVRWNEGKLEIEINKSASPLIYKLTDQLPKEKKVTAFQLKARFIGNLPPARQNFPEDFPLRIGFVLKGNKRLAWWQRAAAANWVKELFKLAPAGVGLDKIHFFSLTSDPTYIGKFRVHPQSELMFETVIGTVPLTPKEADLVTLQYRFETPLEVVALWFSMDGDQTQSNFQIKIDELVLQVLNED
jgi:hypothetical protein